MKLHDESCTNCISTEGEDVCFDSLGEMMDYGESRKPWYQKAWEAIYYPIYSFFYWGIWDKIRPGTLKHYYQRARYGYSYRDCWSVDWHLANIIPKMIRQLKQNTPVHPVDMTMDEWKDILDKIARAFELEYEILDNTLYDCKTKSNEQKVKQLIEKENHFEGCRIMTAEERKKKDEGWRLFKRYFHSLWD